MTQTLTPLPRVANYLEKNIENGPHKSETEDEDSDLEQLRY